MKIEIEVPEFTEEQILQAVAEQIADEHSDLVKLRIREAVAAHVAANMTEAVKTEIASAVADVIENRWQPTDNYGHPTGERQSLSQRVGRYLEHKDGYNKDKTIDELIKTGVRNVMKDELEPIAEAARKQLSEMLGRGVLEMVDQAVRGAVGLKAR